MKRSNCEKNLYHLPATCLNELFIYFTQKESFKVYCNLSFVCTGLRNVLLPLNHIPTIKNLVLEKFSISKVKCEPPYDENNFYSLYKILSILFIKKTQPSLLNSSNKVIGIETTKSSILRKTCFKSELRIRYRNLITFSRKYTLFVQNRYMTTKSLEKFEKKWIRGYDYIIVPKKKILQLEDLQKEIRKKSEKKNEEENYKLTDEIIKERNAQVKRLNKLHFLEETKYIQVDSECFRNEDPTFRTLPIDFDKLHLKIENMIRSQEKVNVSEVGVFDLEESVLVNTEVPWVESVNPPKRRRKSLLVENTEILNDQDANEISTKKSHCRYYLSEYSKDFHDDMTKISKECVNVKFYIALGCGNYRFQRTYKNGKLLKNENKFTSKDISKKSQKYLTAEEHFVNTCVSLDTTSRLKKRVGGAMFGKIKNLIKKGKQQLLKHSYMITSKEGKQYGFMKSYTMTRESRFLKEGYLEEFLKSSFKYVYHADIRRKGTTDNPGFKFENYVNIKFRNRQKDVVITIDDIILEIGDESLTLDGSDRFLLCYTRGLLEKYPLKEVCLEPNKFMHRALKFFEGLEAYGGGLTQLVKDLEKNDLKKIISEKRQLILLLCDNYGFSDESEKIRKCEAVHLCVKSNLKFLCDLSEVWNYILCQCYPQTDINIVLRYLRISDKNPKHNDANPVEWSKFLPKSSIVCAFRGIGPYKCPEDIPTHLKKNPDYPCVIEGKCGKDFLMELLHDFNKRDSTDRCFFLRFSKLLFFMTRQTPLAGEHPDWRINYRKFIEGLADSSLITKKCFKIDAYSNEVIFGHDLSFFDEKKNRRFMEVFSDPKNSTENQRLLLKIASIQHSDIEKSMKKIHKHFLLDQYKDHIEVQSLLYEEKYLAKHEIVNLFKYMDNTDARRDPVMIKIENCCKYYRTLEFELVEQIVRGGKGNIFDVQNMENVHKKYKHRRRNAFAYTTSEWKECSIPNLRDGKPVKMNSKMMANFSAFMLYTKVQLNQDYHFPGEVTSMEPIKIREKKVKSFDKTQLPQETIIQRLTEELVNIDDDDDDDDMMDLDELPELLDPEDDDDMMGLDELPELLDPEEEKEADIEEKGIIVQNIFDNLNDIKKPHTTFFKNLKKLRIESLRLVDKFLEIESMNDYSGASLETIKVDFSRRFSVNQTFARLVAERFFHLGQVSAIDDYFNFFFGEKNMFRDLMLNGECSFGKTRVMSTIILLILAGRDFKIVYNTKIRLLLGFVEELTMLCSKLGVIVPTVFHAYSKTKKQMKKCVEEFKAKKCSILLTNFLGNKNLDPEDFEGLLYVYFVDESQYITYDPRRNNKQKRSLAKANMFSIACKAKCRVFSTWTPFNENFKNVSAQLSVFRGKDVKIKDIPAMKLNLKNDMMVKRIQFDFTKQYFVINVELNRDLRDYYEKYCELFGVNQTQNASDSWVVTQKSIQTLNRTTNSVDIGYNDLFGSEEFKEFKIFDGFKKRVQKNNPKLAIILKWIEYVIQRGEKGILVVSHYDWGKFLYTELQALQRLYPKEYPFLKGTILFVNSYDTLIPSKRKGGSMKEKIKPISSSNVQSREKYIHDEFKNVEGGKILISMSKLIESGGNFKEANHIMSTTIIPNGTSNIQLPPRIIRFGQLKHCTIIQLLCHQTLETHHFIRFVIKKVCNHQWLVNGVTPNLEEFQNRLKAERIDYSIPGSIPSSIRPDSVLFKVLSQCSEHIRGVIDFSDLIFGPPPTHKQLS